MKQKDYINEFKKITQAQVELTERKNSDYADTNDAFANFRMIELLTRGRITTEIGIITRMTDKLQRVANLLSREAQVKDEKIEDTLMDLSIYSKILLIYLKNKNENKNTKS